MPSAPPSAFPHCFCQHLGEAQKEKISLTRRKWHRQHKLSIRRQVRCVLLKKNLGLAPDKDAWCPHKCPSAFWFCRQNFSSVKSLGNVIIECRRKSLMSIIACHKKKWILERSMTVYREEYLHLKECWIYRASISRKWEQTSPDYRVMKPNVFSCPGM